MKYGVLSQKHTEYKGDVWRELDDLYEGGYEILDRVEKYMPRLIGERLDYYQERLKCAAYICYLGQVVDFFVADLFSQEIRITTAADSKDPGTLGGEPPDPDFYRMFESDADRKGKAFSQLMREAFTHAIVKGKCLIAVDLPRKTDEAVIESFADEERLGLLRAYAYEIPVEQLIDWKLGDDGRYDWCIVHRCLRERNSPEDVRGKMVEEFKVWRRDLATGLVSWSLYRTRPFTEDDPIKDNEDIPVVDSDVTKLPLIPIVELVIPKGLWVGNKIGPLNKEHFQRRNVLNSSQNKSLFAIPWARLGPEIGAIGGPVPSDAQQDPHRGDDPKTQFQNKGYVVLGADDDIGFAEPNGGAYGIIAAQLEKLKDEMFRTIHQMAASVSNTGASLGRSGDSKEEDRKSTATVLGAFGALVRSFSKKIYDTVAEVRGEKGVIWHPHGLDSYDCEPRAPLVDEATKVDMINIPSKTFKKQYKTHLALKLLPNMRPETAAVIKDEIDDGVESEPLNPQLEMQQAELDIKAKAAEKPVVAAAPQQKAKKPSGKP